VYKGALYDTYHDNNNSNSGGGGAIRASDGGGVNDNDGDNGLAGGDMKRTKLAKSTTQPVWREVNGLLVVFVWREVVGWVVGVDRRGMSSLL
jgi:hypothetical protein